MMNRRSFLKTVTGIIAGLFTLPSLAKEKPKLKCSHNQRCRYTTGFYCEDCGMFFSKGSRTYRSGEKLSDIHMVLHNIRADSIRNGQKPDIDVQQMMDKIGIGIKHENYEELIFDSESILKRYNKDSDSSSLTIK